MENITLKINDIVRPLCLGELYAGSLGMHCEKCNKATWTVWLYKEEVEFLQLSNRVWALIVCENKFGKILCNEHGREICKPMNANYSFSELASLLG